jgi:REP element-mobilizing transposase RayT
MKYNSKVHHRRSIRLKNYDYSQEGAYFITICTQNRECLFGEIHLDVGADLCVCPNMILNDAGKMIEKWYFELENKFLDFKCDESVIMPNHFHCIIQNVGADLRVCQKKKGEHIGSPYEMLCNGSKP